jgi:hypothetical protein
VRVDRVVPELEPMGCEWGPSRGAGVSEREGTLLGLRWRDGPR